MWCFFSHTDYETSYISGGFPFVCRTVCILHDPLVGPMPIKELKKLLKDRQMGREGKESTTSKFMISYLSKLPSSG